MNILFLFRFANTIGTTIFVVQVVWWIFKKYQELESSKKKTSEIQSIFKKEFLKQFNRIPSKEELDVTIKAVNAVDHPLKEKITNFIESLMKEKNG